MRKKILFITSCILVLALLLAVFLYAIPKETPIDIDLFAEKRDGSGKIVGIVPITIKGVLKEYLFQPDVLDIEVTSTDGLLDWDFQYSNNIPIEVTDKDGLDLRFASYTKDKMTIKVYFSTNLQRWMFEVYDPSLQAVYLLSGNASDTWDDLYEFFKEIQPLFLNET